MLSPTVQVAVVDALGIKQTFRADRLMLDCGTGKIEIRAGHSIMLVGFVSLFGALRLKAGGEVSSAMKGMDRLLPIHHKASIQDLLEARDQLLMVEMESVNALRDFHLFRVRLRATTQEMIR